MAAIMKKRIVAWTKAKASKTNMADAEGPDRGGAGGARSLLGPRTLRANLPTVARLPKTNQAVPTSR